MRRQLFSFERVVAAIALLLVIGFYVYAYFLIPAMQELFRDMGLPIPTRTQFVLDTYLYWFVFLAAGLGGFSLIFWFQNRRGWYLLLTAVLSVLILLPITVWAMYGPVMG